MQTRFNTQKIFSFCTTAVLFCAFSFHAHSAFATSELIADGFHYEDPKTHLTFDATMGEIESADAFEASANGLAAEIQKQHLAHPQAEIHASWLETEEVRSPAGKDGKVSLGKKLVKGVTSRLSKAGVSIARSVGFMAKNEAEEALRQQEKTWYRRNYRLSWFMIRVGGILGLETIGFFAGNLSLQMDAALLGVVLSASMITASTSIQLNDFLDWRMYKAFVKTHADHWFSRLTRNASLGEVLDSAPVAARKVIDAAMVSFMGPSYELVKANRFGKWIEGGHSSFNFSLEEIGFGGYIVLVEKAVMDHMKRGVVHPIDGINFLEGVAFSTASQGEYEKFLKRSANLKLAQGMSLVDVNRYRVRMSAYGSIMSVVGFTFTNFQMPLVRGIGYVTLGTLGVTGIIAQKILSKKEEAFYQFQLDHPCNTALHAEEPTQLDLFEEPNPSVEHSSLWSPVLASFALAV